MEYNGIRKRKSARLQNYDYGKGGWFFVTLCNADRKPTFGQVDGAELKRSELGVIITEEWLKSAEIRKEVKVEEWILMPNHLHAVVSIGEKEVSPRGEFGAGAAAGRPYRSGLGAFVAGFKSAVTSRARKMGINEVWQRSFHEHVVRGDEDLYRICEYIRNNPLKWELDRENPERREDNPEEERWF